MDTQKNALRRQNGMDMTGKTTEKKIQLSRMTDLVRSAVTVLMPLTVTAVIAVLRLLTEDVLRSAGWDVCCLVITVLAWLGAVVCTKTRLLGKSMPGTGLAISAMLLVSVLAFVLAYAMEQEIFGFYSGLWAMGKLLGGPAAVSVDGMRCLLGGVPEGAAAMMAGGIYLALSLAAAFPVRDKKTKK